MSGEEDERVFIFNCKDYDYELRLTEQELQEFIDRGFNFEYLADDYIEMENLVEKLAEWYNVNKFRNSAIDANAMEDLYRIMAEASAIIHPKL